MELDTIQWYPGHMVKARKLVGEHLKLVDLVIELLDARIPNSSRNPEIDAILGGKQRIIVLNKADLADKSATEKWKNHFLFDLGTPCITIDSKTGRGVSQLVNDAQELAARINEKLAAKGRRPRPVRMMMVGIPNVGKSSLINRLAGKGSAKTEDRPGVTRGKQWIKVGRQLEMLDTPGILWPKFEDPEVGFRLAATGAIKDQILNTEQIAVKLINLISEKSPESLQNRFKLDRLADEPFETLQHIGAKRGFLAAGGIVDTGKTATMFLSEFRAGKIGLFTLD